MNFINWITKTKKLILFHPESPGMKIIVYRNFLGGLFKDSDFATLNETIKFYDELLGAHNSTTIAKE